MKQRIMITLFLLLLPLAAVTEEHLVYESFSGVTIGRVFLSQSERDMLDAQRLDGPQAGVAGAVVSGGDAVKSKPLASAGYIIGHNGRSKVWKDGDFVDSRSNSARSMSFPGDVKITRHVVADNAVEDESSETDGKNSVQRDGEPQRDGD